MARKRTVGPKILAISEADKVGASTQAIGLAQAVATLANGTAYHVTVAPPKGLSLYQRVPGLRRFVRPSHSLINKHANAAIVIGCGNAVAPIVQSFGALTGTFTAWIQRPPPDLPPFDAVIAPQHDQVAGDHALGTIGALNPLDPASIARRAAFAPPHLQQLPQPRLALLFGGSNRAYQLDVATCEALTVECLHAVRRVGGSAMISSSRRTDKRCVDYLRALQAPDVYQWHWGSSVSNPYLDFLALADVAAVTVDSVNLISEASTAKLPVLLLELQIIRNKRAAAARRRFDAFHRSMRQRDLARPWLGWLERWNVPGLNETKRAAEWLWRRYLMGRSAEFPVSGI